MAAPLRRDGRVPGARRGGLRLRQQPARRGAHWAASTSAFAYPGFVEAYVRPLFCTGHRAVPLGGALGRPGRHRRHRRRAWASSSPRTSTCSAGSSWRARAIAFQGLPARICWLGYGERHRAGLRFNELVRSGEVSAPIVIGRDHLDSGSVASPYRETEGMLDGSDAIADWPILNALLGRLLGRGLGRACTTAAASASAARSTRARRSSPTAPTRARCASSACSRTIPGTGVMRHADAGYELARETRARARPRPADAAVTARCSSPISCSSRGGAVRAGVAVELDGGRIAALVDAAGAGERSRRRAPARPAARPGPRQRALARLPAPPARPRRGARPRRTRRRLLVLARGDVRRGRGARPARRCARSPRSASTRARRAGYTAVGEFHYVHHRPDGTPYEEPNELALAVIEAARAVGVRIVLLLAAYARGGARPRPERRASGASATRSVEAYLGAGRAPRRGGRGRSAR